MALNNSATRFGAVAKSFHWIIALGIIAVIPLGIIAHDAPFGTVEELALKANLFSAHKTIGVVIFVAALARILWALSQPKPVPLHPERKLETFLAETVHWLLYGSLVIVPLAGWIHHAATSGFAPIWWPFGQSLPFVPKSEQVSHIASVLHVVFERVLLVSLILHVLGAIKHHSIDRDSTLRRMLPGSTEAGVPGTVHQHVVPMFSACVAWAAAIAIAFSTGAFEVKDAPQVAALEAASSDWDVQEGVISLEIKQFGSAVTGSFTDWTAAIEFQERDTLGKAGQVTVTISVPSLELGTVVAQAMGADFFDAQNFPTAQFSADLVKVADGYEAQGTLTIREKSVPVTLPYSLEITDDLAKVAGQLTLDRRDFEIGSKMTDPGQLGFEVSVGIELTAVQAKSQP